MAPKTSMQFFAFPAALLVAAIASLTTRVLDHASTDHHGDMAGEIVSDQMGNQRENFQLAARGASLLQYELHRANTQVKVDNGVPHIDGTKLLAVYTAESAPRTDNTKLQALSVTSASGGAAHALSATEGASEFSEPAIKPTFERPECKWMILAWAIVVCCGGCIYAFLGPVAGYFCQFFTIVFIIVYVIISGIYGAWRAGQPIGFACQIVCWLVFFNLLICCCECLCGFCVGVPLITAWLAIRNESIKQMHQEYTEKRQTLSGPRREYYESEFFQDKCDRMFRQADSDGNGSLSMAELHPVIVQEIGDMQEMQVKCMFIHEAFGANRDSSVERAEFFHMMQYLSLMKFREGAFTEDSAWEVFQLDPRTATQEEVNKTYKQMSLRYHPDKRYGVSEEDKTRDMAEINDAKRILDAKFRSSDDNRQQNDRVGS